jgi:hypothetical protein
MGIPQKLMNIMVSVILRQYYKNIELLLCIFRRMDFLNRFGFIANAGHTKRQQTQRKHQIPPNKTVKNAKHIKQKMTCSPHSAHIKPSYLHDTCYTPAILERIKNEYNKIHPAKDHIRTKDPTKIWKELDERLSHCNKEDCWLNQIRDPKLRKQIDRYMFAPDQPYEWKRNPNEWLSNYDILNVLEQYELVYPNFEFIGPTPIDFDTRLGGESNAYNIGNERKLPEGDGAGKKCVWNDLCHFSLKEKIREKKTKIGIIFNLDKHDESGSHWVSLFIDIKCRFLFYFDSAGGDMPPEIKALIDRIQSQAKELRFRFKSYTNGNHDHQKGNTECGMYSLFFIVTMLTGKHTPTSKKMHLGKILELFLHGNIPDKTMEDYRDEYFNA